MPSSKTETKVGSNKERTEAGKDGGKKGADKREIKEGGKGGKGGKEMGKEKKASNPFDKALAARVSSRAHASSSATPRVVELGDSWADGGKAAAAPRAEEGVLASPLFSFSPHALHILTVFIHLSLLLPVPVLDCPTPFSKCLHT